jgi:hypothetical protein
MKDFRVVYFAKELEKGGRLTRRILIDLEHSAGERGMHGGLCKT